MAELSRASPRSPGVARLLPGLLPVAGLPAGTEVTLFRDDRAVLVRIRRRRARAAAREVGLAATRLEVEAGSDRAVSQAHGAERVELAQGRRRSDPRGGGARRAGDPGRLAAPNPHAGQLCATAARGPWGWSPCSAWRLAKREERTLAGLEDRVRQRTEDLAAALAARELLLKEVHHRVKNN